MSARRGTAGCTRRRRSARSSRAPRWCRWPSTSNGAASTLLWAVAGYGLATVVFGLSRSFWLTFICLALIGATDTVSMVIRNIIRQLETPDRLRGRMTGVNMVFFIGGPQLGEFEAGAVANWLGATFSVVSGGVGCLIATAWVARDHAGVAAVRKAGSGTELRREFSIVRTSPPSVGPLGQQVVSRIAHAVSRIRLRPQATEP